MKSGFNVYRKLDDGQVVHVAWRKDAQAAESLLADLNSTWPGEYGYREANGEPLSPAPKSAIRSLTQPNTQAQAKSQVQSKYSN